jgi:hypothetical protein
MAPGPGRASRVAASASALTRHSSRAPGRRSPRRRRCASTTSRPSWPPTSTRVPRIPRRSPPDQERPGPLCQGSAEPRALRHSTRVETPARPPRRRRDARRSSRAGRHSLRVARCVHQPPHQPTPAEEPLGPRSPRAEAGARDGMSASGDGDAEPGRCPPRQRQRRHRDGGREQHDRQGGAETRDARPGPGAIHSASLAASTSLRTNRPLQKSHWVRALLAWRLAPGTG